MADLGEMVMQFGGDDRDFQQAAARVERTIGDVAARFSQSPLSSFQFSLNGVNAVGVEIGKLGNLTEQTTGKIREMSGWLTRAGRFGTFSVAATGLASMGKAAEEFAKQIAIGQANTSDLVEAIAVKIPFGIGKLIEFGRSVRKIIDGDDAAVAKSEQDTKNQEAKIELQKRLAAAILEVGRRAEDTRQKLDFNLTKSPFFNSVQDILKGGERSAQDFLAKRTDQEKLLKEATDRRLELIRKLEEVRKEPEFFQTTDAGEDAFPNLDRAGRLADLQKEVDKNAASVRDYTNELARLNDVINEKGGRPVFTALANLVGGEVVKAFDKAGDAVTRYIDKVTAKPPELDEFTKALLNQRNAVEAARGGGVRQFNIEQSGLQEARRQGIIDPAAFNQLSSKSIADFVARSLSQLIERNAPAVQTAANFFSSGFLGPLRGLGIQNALANLPNLLPGSINTQPRFSPSTVGLTELGSRIQASAAGDPVVKKLDEVKDWGRRTAENTAKVESAIKDWGRRPAVVAKG